MRAVVLAGASAGQAQIAAILNALRGGASGGILREEGRGTILDAFIIGCIRWDGAIGDVLEEVGRAGGHAGPEDGVSVVISRAGVLAVASVVVCEGPSGAELDALPGGAVCEVGPRAGGGEGDIVLVLASLVVVEGVALVRADRDAHPVASGRVFVPEGPDEAAVLHAGGGVVIREVVVAAGGPAPPAVVCVCVLPLGTKRNTRVGVSLAEVGPLRRTDRHAGLSFIVGELSPGAIGNTCEATIISKQIGQ